MPPVIAAVIFAVGIYGLFVLERDRKTRSSKALWIPVVWLLINGSRPVSQWLQRAPAMDSPERYLDGSPLDALVFGTLLAAGLVVLVAKRSKVAILLQASGPILVFFVYCAVSILWADYPLVALKRWIKALGDITMVLVVLTDRDPSSSIKRFLSRVGFLLVPLSILLIKYYPALSRSYNPWTWEPTYAGVTMNKNLLGMTCLVVGIASTWRVVTAYRSHKDKTRTHALLVHGVLLGMVVWLFYVANSMTSLSCFVLASSLIIVANTRTAARKPELVHLCVVAIVLISMVALFFDAGAGLIRTIGRDPSLTGRTGIWSATIGAAGNAFFGTGFESFWLGQRLLDIWKLTGPGINEAHNGYLEIYLNLGWIGIALFALVLVTGYKKVVLALWRDPSRGSLYLAFFVAAVIYSMTEAGFRMMSPVWISFLLAIVAAPEVRSLPSRAPHVQERLTDAFSAAGAQFPVGGFSADPVVVDCAVAFGRDPLCSKQIYDQRG